MSLFTELKRRRSCCADPFMQISFNGQILRPCA